MEKQALPLNAIQTEPQMWFNRFHAAVYTSALFALFYHRLLSLLRSPTFLSFTSFLAIALADMVLSLLWLLCQACRWTPVRRHAFPENLRARFADADLPPLDVFICTADPYKEPPMNVANTALSVMALDYQADKISVYVSDDGGSKLTLFAFMEAARFAKQWIPFCKENKIKGRNPQAYFAGDGNGDGPTTVPKGWRELKATYEEMKERVEIAVERGDVPDDLDEEESKAFRKWTAGFTKHDHPTVIQVLLAAEKDADSMGNAMPKLVYVSRQKSRAAHHNFKAGALNVLLRVSSVMSNAPILLNLDCDMYSNDPMVVHRALCFFLDPPLSTNLAFLQFPQVFPGINKHDTYGNEYKRLFHINPLGFDGSLGPNFLGTGTFFQRRAFAGKPLKPPHPELVRGQSSFMNGGVREPTCSEATMEAAHAVAASNYEQGSEWGSTIGYRYGSLVEDYYTGYLMQCEGWRSAFYSPPEPAFLANFPICLLDMLNQCRRWCVGLLEVPFSRWRSPLTYGTRKASIITGMCYAHYAFWPLWSIPLIIYALLPQFALLIGLPLFPKASDPWIYLYTYLFLGSYGQDMIDYIMEGGTFARWWNDQRIWLIRGVSCFLFGLFDYLLQRMGISIPGFHLTNKDVDDQVVKRYKQGLFEFGVDSPMFFTISATAVISLVALVVGGVRVVMQGDVEEMMAQLFISGFAVVNSWPVYEAMVVRRDGGRMPTKITVLAALSGCAFYMVSEFARRNWT
ncbi:cellulose synthase-like protein G2 [Nymphaea colorata]|nr:cellulose synthase-like protein G2 [Nymphaea colorata]